MGHRRQIPDHPPKAATAVVAIALLSTVLITPSFARAGPHDTAQQMHDYLVDGNDATPTYPTIVAPAYNRTVVHADASQIQPYAVTVRGVDAFDRYALVAVPQDPAAVRKALSGPLEPVEDANPGAPTTGLECLGDVCGSAAVEDLCRHADKNLVPYTPICPRLSSDSRCVDHGCRVILASGSKTATGHDATSREGHVTFGPVWLPQGRYYVYHVPDRLPDDRDPDDWVVDQAQDLYGDALCTWGLDDPVGCLQDAADTYAECRPGQDRIVVACIDVEVCAPAAPGDDGSQVCAGSDAVPDAPAPGPQAQAAGSGDFCYSKPEHLATWVQLVPRDRTYWTGSDQDIQQADSLDEEEETTPPSQGGVATDTDDAGLARVDLVLHHVLDRCDEILHSHDEIGWFELSVKGPTEIDHFEDWELSLVGTVQEPFYVDGIPHWVELEDPYIHVPRAPDSAQPDYTAYGPYRLSDWSGSYDERSFDEVADQVAWHGGCAASAALAAYLSGGSAYPFAAGACQFVKWYLEDEDDPSSRVQASKAHHHWSGETYDCRMSEGCWDWAMTAGPRDADEGRAHGFSVDLAGGSGCAPVQVWFGFDRVVTYALKDGGYPDTEQVYHGYWDDEDHTYRDRPVRPRWPLEWEPRTNWPDAQRVEIPVTWGQDRHCGHPGEPGS